MTRSFRWIGYGILGCVAFVVFLYWSFPYGLVKERLIAALEQQLGGMTVTIESLKPSWFTGVKLKNVRFATREGDTTTVVWQADRVRARVGLFSLLTGRPRVNFSLRAKTSRIHGSFQRLENGFQLALDLDPFDVAELAYLKGVAGINLQGAIEGTLRLQMNMTQIAQSQGEIHLTFKDWKIKKGSRLAAGMTSDEGLKEDLVLTKGEGSGLKVGIAKGAADVGQLQFSGGDVEMMLAGQGFLSQRIANVRMNINGQCKFSAKANQEFPFLFILEKQKQADGTYPLTMAGNLNKPQIKIGDFPIYPPPKMGAF